ncbi:MAG: hypothetical protein ACRDRG_17520 [Pseudonocardiaceae bacterium]
MDTREGLSIDWWPWAFVAGGMLGCLGGLLHPDMDPTLSGPPVLAAWVGDPLWIPSHSMILASSLLFLPGLLGLVRSRVPLPRTARQPASVAAAASIVLILESIAHLAAAFDEAAVLAGQPTPFLTGHLMGAVIAYPLFGFSVAALAVLSGRSLAHPIIGVLGAIGAAAWGLAPLAVGPLGIDALGVLFSGGLLMAAWFAAVGLRALKRRRSDVLDTTTASSAGS